MITPDASLAPREKPPAPVEFRIALDGICNPLEVNPVLNTDASSLWFAFVTILKVERAAVSDVVLAILKAVSLF